MFGQHTCDLLAYGTVLLDQLWIDVQHVNLGLVRVANVARKKNCRCARHVCDTIGKQSARAGFSNRQRLIALRQ